MVIAFAGFLGLPNISSRLRLPDALDFRLRRDADLAFLVVFGDIALVFGAHQ